MAAHILDDLWERVKLRYPRLRLFDETYDQSHIHHTLNTVLIFGTVGMLLSAIELPFLAAFDWRFIVGPGFACGIVGGLIGYLIRELGSGRTALVGGRPTPTTYWDGSMDVFVPVWITLGPALFLLHGAPTWFGPAFYVATALAALSYTFLRPDCLHYDRSKD